jgi:hypothetical protein
LRGFGGQTSLRHQSVHSAPGDDAPLLPPTNNRSPSPAHRQNSLRFQMAWRQARCGTDVIRDLRHFQTNLAQLKLDTHIQHVISSTQRIGLNSDRF